MRARTVLFLLSAMPCGGWGQATPAASIQPSVAGVNLPRINGTFQYGLSASEVISNGYGGDGGVFAQTSLSGDLAYASKSEIHPFSALYAGGTQLGNQSGISNVYYQSLSLSQGYVTKNWVFGLSDVVSYLPQSPTVGLSGIPGSGDVGFTPIGTDLQPTQNVLSVGNARISNTAGGTAERRLGAFTSISGGASYGILRFFGDGGLDSSQISADVAVNRRIDARSSVSLAATYGTFSYSGLGDGASFVTRGLSASYQRQLSRSISASVTGGPEWISSSSTLGIPSRVIFSGGAGLSYVVRAYNASVSYTRGINGGSGVVPGGVSDSIVGSLQRPFGTAWSASVNAGFARTQGLSDTPTTPDLALLGLVTTGDYKSTFGGAQVSRRLTRSFSAFASYTALNQSSGQTQGSSIALNGIVQSFALGISYFPHSLHLGQF